MFTFSFLLHHVIAPRYLKEILPHKACHQVFDDCLNAAREFCNRVQSGTKPHRKGHKIGLKSENNMKTMRIAYSFLKNAHLRFQRRGETMYANTVRALQEAVYAFWGPQLFEDKIDPNTANQTLALSKAEESLENMQHHIHSLWVFLQHQKWWEFQFQDKNMKKFKMEYTNHEKEEKKKAMTNQDQFDKYYIQCSHNYQALSATEMNRLEESINAKRKRKRDVARDLKKYMDFFDEDFQCRFPNENTPDFWELDPRESSSNHTRLLLVRNFKGTDHSHAAVGLGQNLRKRKGSNYKSRKGSTGGTGSESYRERGNWGGSGSVKSSPSMEAKNPNNSHDSSGSTLLKQISHGIMKEMDLTEPPRLEMTTGLSMESITEGKENGVNGVGDDTNNGMNEGGDNGVNGTEDQMQNEGDTIDSDDQEFDDEDDDGNVVVDDDDNDDDDDDDDDSSVFPNKK